MRVPPQLTDSPVDELITEWTVGGGVCGREQVTGGVPLKGVTGPQNLPLYPFTFLLL